jgi:hypothetical protein
MKHNQGLTKRIVRLLKKKDVFHSKKGITKDMVAQWFEGDQGCSKDVLTWWK